MTNASRDDNFVSTILGVSSVDLSTPTPVKVNPVTGAMLAEVAASTGTVPVGGIILWSGTIANIPTNWALCNGSNGTPDLRNSFIVGASSDDAGVAKTNLTGSLTVSGGSISHHHSDHTLSTNVAIDNHSLSTSVAIADHTITQPVISAHSRSTDVALSTHALTTNVGIASHTLTTNVGLTAVVASYATGTARSAVPSATVTQPVVSTHTITQPVVESHTITQPVFANHTLSTNVALTAHTITQPVVSTHTITQPVVSTHDTLSAPQPYYALAYIMRVA